MLELAERAVRAALACGAEYADARIVRSAAEELCLRNGALVEGSAPFEFGLGIRVLVQGTFGFAAAPGTHRELADLIPGVARRATRAARDLAATRRRKIELAPLTPSVGEHRTPVAEDPFGVPLEEKLELLRAADAGLAAKVAGEPTGAELVVREARMSFRRAEHWLATSEGTRVHQVLVRSGGGIAATASAGGVVERRSYPNSFGGDYHTGGFEVVRALDLAREAPRVRAEALALSVAPPCPAGRRTLILGPAQLMLQIHESVGHPTELDRALGEEIDLAGASFATVDGLGRMRFGSPLVNLYGDSTEPGGLDTRGFDDEGVPSVAFDIVRDGVFVGYHTSREWAAQVQETASTGTLRAEGWWAPPIVRMTNLSLRPGHGTLAELLASTEDGAIYADTVKMWSIDQRRLNFQFTCEVGYEVVGGKLGRLFRSPTYQGTTPEFWGGCDAIAGPSEWRLHGVPNCGKGNPMQIAEMSHGAAPARFRGVEFVAL
ncbi:MAG: TldD/PmbA family protein [Planctomycetota bacterium]